MNAMKQLPALVLVVLLAAATYTGAGCGSSSAPPPGPPPPSILTELSGTVRDAVNAAPLYPATVTVRQDERERSTATDDRGYYYVDRLARGPVHVTASAPGHETFEKDVTITDGRNTLDIELRRAP